MKLFYKVSLHKKLSDKALILSLMPHRVAQKCNVMHDYAYNARR